MHFIEQRLHEYLDDLATGKATIAPELIEEFRVRCGRAVTENLLQINEGEFGLRMSNIGRGLRQLCLARDNPRYGRSPALMSKMFYGYLYESYMFMLLRASGLGVDGIEVPVSYQFKDAKVLGTYDVCIDGKIYDIKTASDWAYKNKFSNFETLREEDSFGYFGQGFGYALADSKPFGGWIVMNKSDGSFKVVEIPQTVHDELKDYYEDEINYKISYVTSGKAAPECDGVIKETFRRTETGNRVLNKNCEFCNHKFQCHPTLSYAPDAHSEAKSPKWKYYVGEIITKEDKDAKAKDEAQAQAQSNQDKEASSS